MNENVSTGTQVAKSELWRGYRGESGGTGKALSAGSSKACRRALRFNALSDRSYAGTVTEVGVAAGGSAATFPVVVTLDESDSQLRPGMAAEVTFEFASGRTSSFSIPSAAVINDEQGNFVFIARPSEGDTATIERRAVQTGELTANGVEILDGLTDGDRVVTAGVSVIRDGQTVLLPEE